MLILDLAGLRMVLGEVVMVVHDPIPEPENPCHCVVVATDGDMDLLKERFHRFVQEVYPPQAKLEDASGLRLREKAESVFTLFVPEATT